MVRSLNTGEPAGWLLWRPGSPCGPPPAPRPTHAPWPPQLPGPPCSWDPWLPGPPGSWAHPYSWAQGRSLLSLSHRRVCGAYRPALLLQGPCGDLGPTWHKTPGRQRGAQGFPAMALEPHSNSNTIFTPATQGQSNQHNPTLSRDWLMSLRQEPSVET